jgi:uncharacterized protein (DUF488 family)
MSKNSLFTTGYSGHDQSSFLALMQDNGVDVVIDVRRNPVSRKRGFSKTGLGEFLKANGIEYRHSKDLGVPQNLRADLKAGTCELADYLTGFREYLGDQLSALEEVYNLACRKTCCLLCVEQCSDECHRSVVAEEVAALNGRTVRIVHV